MQPTATFFKIPNYIILVNILFFSVWTATNPSYAHLTIVKIISTFEVPIEDSCLRCNAQKFQKLEGWLIKSNSGGGMILCFQCEDISKIFLVSKYETNRPNIKLIKTFCAIWHYQDVKGEDQL